MQTPRRYLDPTNTKEYYDGYLYSYDRKQALECSLNKDQMQKSHKVTPIVV